MNKSMKIEKMSGLVLTLVLLSFIVDMGGAFHIKDFAFIIVIIYDFYLLTVIALKLPSKLFLVEGVIFGVFPVILMLTSYILFNIPFSISINELSSFLLFALFPIFLTLDSNIIYKKIKNMLYYASLIVIFTFIMLLIFGVLNLTGYLTAIDSFTRKYNIGYIGQAGFLGLPFFAPNVYYKWSMWLIGSVIFNIENRKRLLVSLFAMALTFSTAVILFSVLGVIIWLIINRKYTSLIKMTFISLFIIGIFLSISSTSNIIFGIFSKFSINNISTLRKVETIKSILPLFKDGTTAIIGMGIGSEFYSFGVNRFVSSVEVSHFNMMRQFGLIYSFLFFGFIIWRSISFLRRDTFKMKLGLTLLLLFFAAGTNPLLLSPIVFLFIVLSSSEEYKKKINRKVV